MTFTVKLMHDLPVMLVHFEPEFRISADYDAYEAEVDRVLDSVKDPVYYVFDLLDWSTFTLEELMHATNRAARNPGTNFRHRNTKALFPITKDIRLRMTANALTHVVYGSLNVKPFVAVEDALQFVRADLLRSR